MRPMFSLCFAVMRSGARVPVRRAASLPSGDLLAGYGTRTDCRPVGQSHRVLGTSDDRCSFLHHSGRGCSMAISDSRLMTLSPHSLSALLCSEASWAKFGLCFLKSSPTGRTTASLWHHAALGLGCALGICAAGRVSQVSKRVSPSRAFLPGTSVVSVILAPE
jgi:hypothetical protein